jgi:NAD(P)-dependent dehydrogenase (short-subunit alcohol dehydrogenase family)
VDLQGQTVLVTGANRGIGRRIVEALATREAHVLAGMRDPSDFEPVSGGSAREIAPLRIDLATRDSIEESLAELGDRRVDVLVNNAGRFEGGLFEDGDVDAYYELVQVNLGGSYTSRSACCGRCSGAVTGRWSTTRASRVTRTSRARPCTRRRRPPSSASARRSGVSSTRAR